ncbi:MAG: ATP-dependent endonuclease [Mucilaginibacter sp.]|nr:ATP-dependent endonuclease [Mucilaginibacter sp.]
MLLSTVKISGFRNFKEATINFAEKSLIIGANDVGKTNLIWAIRLLMDKGISEYDVEPQDSDFYAFEDTNEFSILLCFKEVKEDCVVAKLKGKISDTDELYLQYKGYRDAVTKTKTYKLFAGKDIASLEEINDRYYRKVLNLKYISSRRDFHNYINKEKANLFQTAKESREDAEVKKDETLYAEISTSLTTVDKKIPELSYIAKATETINTELNKLSIHHQTQEIVFDANTSNVDSFINSVSIASKSNNKNLVIGGDGKLNQIFLSLWASRNKLADDLEEVSIICIEEPEAHLHPHQQRKLAEYLGSTLNGQVLITTHSPQIACEYSPNSIIRLVPTNAGTKAASDGCSKIIDDAFKSFGYRLSIIPAEAFFADVVFLIEGPSEEMFYKTLAKQLDIDLDRLNISVLMVAGVGFETFIKILRSLEIEWVLRTDNDISKIPTKTEYTFAGVNRIVNYYEKHGQKDAACDAVIAQYKAQLRGFPTNVPPQANLDAAKNIIDALALKGSFVSTNDLEADLVNSTINAELQTHYGKTVAAEIVAAMQSAKAVNMYDFLIDNKDCLSRLKGDAISAPLEYCKTYIEKLYATN